MRARLVASVLAVVTLGACGSDSTATSSASSTSSSSGDSGPATLSAGECGARCGAVATKCGASAAVCSQACAQSITDAQASCLESKSCAQLIALATQGIQAVCPGVIIAAPDADGGFTPPPSLFIGGPLPAGQAPSRAQAEGKVVSSLEVTTKPAFAPTLPANQFPNVAEAYGRVAIVSPSAGACTPTFSFSLNVDTVRVRIEGTDEGAATDCATFIAAAASQGVALTLNDVTWLNTATRSTVTIALR